MAENSKIEWTHHTFNPWRGCTKVSPGCANCYAESMSGRNPGTLGVWGPNGTRVVAAEAAWKEPLKWDRRAKQAEAFLPGQGRPRVFCASLADVFEDWTGPIVESNGATHTVDSRGRPLPKSGGLVPGDRPATMQDVRDRLFRLIDATPNLDWLILTKRPENIGRMMPKRYEFDPGVSSEIGAMVDTPVIRPNVWLGTSVENQKATARIDVLRAIPAAVRFLSVEPLLEDLGQLDLTGISWVIVGGESGPGARAFGVEWARSIVEQCKSAGVPVFVKQLGGRPTTRLWDGETWPGHDGPSSPVRFSGDGFGNYFVSGLRDRKGGDMGEWPADLRVREFPTTEVAHAGR